MESNKESFTRRFLSTTNDLDRIKLCIREGRYTIWTRADKPNFSEEYLLAILVLPQRHEVRRQKRKSGGEGYDYIVEMKYPCRIMGRVLKMYMKGYFAKDGRLVIGLEIQSLRKDE